MFSFLGALMRRDPVRFSRRRLIGNDVERLAQCILDAFRFRQPTLFCPKFCRWNHPTWRPRQTILRSFASSKALICGTIILLLDWRFQRRNIGRKAWQYHKMFAG
ncbi:hypothetical protein HF313_19570 [Massilia atriviolacea]|uniref:Uncharacterized protein n=1 Tax=Massilia atriviolacea TaxID=2495579 RepID=A0A430HSN9_9BURK|nr:hypothetical protein [Massilia atriviolacea]RSZ60497.1 hypothetical protein EJB06_05130 [Massilia atriviolacea]